MSSWQGLVVLFTIGLESGIIGKREGESKRVMQENKKRPPEPFKVRRADVSSIPLTEAEMSPLGRKLMKIFAEIDASDDPPMSEEDFERELEMRRMGYTRNGR